MHSRRERRSSVVPGDKTLPLIVTRIRTSERRHTEGELLGAVLLGGTGYGIPRAPQTEKREYCVCAARREEKRMIRPEVA